MFPINSKVKVFLGYTEFVLYLFPLFPLVSSSEEEEDLSFSLFFFFSFFFWLFLHCLVINMEMIVITITPPATIAPMIIG